MVRLEGCGCDVPLDTALIFQFQNGTIRRSNQRTSNGTLADFNSKMVRLEVQWQADYTQYLVGFQFQNGTIRR